MSKKKILIVDDEPLIRMMTESRLEASGYEVLQATSGMEAMKLLAETKPDLVLLDIVMPAMDGEEFCMKLKSNPDTTKIPVLILTASTRKDLHLKCLKAGAKAVILKPYDSNELLALIRKALDPNGKWRRIVEDE